MIKLAGLLGAEKKVVVDEGAAWNHEREKSVS